MLDDATLDRFMQDGFLELRSAVPTSVVAECQNEIADSLLAEGVDVDEPTTWEPVVRVDCPRTPAFETAGGRQVLTDSCDALLGVGRWWKPRGVGGTIPLRFPSDSDPGDAGWHVDGSYDGDGGYWINVASKARALLCLFLFSDVGPHDAPTELKIGSHLDIPAMLEPFGEAGMNSTRLSRDSSAVHPGATVSFRNGSRGRRVRLSSVPCASRKLAASRHRSADGCAAGNHAHRTVRVRRRRPIAGGECNPPRARILTRPSITGLLPYPCARREMQINAEKW